MLYAKNRVDDLLTNNQLRTILSQSTGVYLCGGGEENRENKNFLGYLRELYPTFHFKAALDIQQLLTAEIKASDVVFSTVLDPVHNRYAIASLLKRGLKPQQVIPPSCFVTKVLAEKEGFIYAKDFRQYQVPFLASIDIVDTCNLQCSTCMRNCCSGTNHRMDLKIFIKILDKLKKIGIQRIELYNFTEPFLHTEAHEFVREVKKRDFSLSVSSNFSLPSIKKLRDTVDLLDLRTDLLIVTISGLTQEIYEINHKKGVLKNVLHNLHQASLSEKRKCIRLRLLHFSYNDSEILATIKLAQELGIEYEIMEAFGNPLQPMQQIDNKLADSETQPEGLSCEDYDAAFQLKGNCMFIHGRNIVINSKGHVELCCNRVTRPYDLGSFLQQDCSVIQLKRALHPGCVRCVFRRDMNVNVETATKIDHILEGGLRVSLQLRHLQPNLLYNIKEAEYLQGVCRYFIKNSQDFNTLREYPGSERSFPY